MRHSIVTGLSFGLTSGIITTLGLMVGLHSSTHSKLVVIGGILTIAVADAFSDALGIHISEESENVHTEKEIWVSTIATLLSKFIFALTFIVPVLLFELGNAILVSIVWGFSLLGILSYMISKEQKKNTIMVIIEHFFIASLVIVITHFVGGWISSFFG
jgi:VIT1/CCC1 family predicted Fe2+/Mn2+ transporter